MLLSKKFVAPTRWSYSFQIGELQMANYKKMPMVNIHLKIIPTVLRRVPSGEYFFGHERTMMGPTRWMVWLWELGVGLLPQDLGVCSPRSCFRSPSSDLPGHVCVGRACLGGLVLSGNYQIPWGYHCHKKIRKKTLVQGVTHKVLSSFDLFCFLAFVFRFFFPLPVNRFLSIHHLNLIFL